MEPRLVRTYDGTWHYDWCWRVPKSVDPEATRDGWPPDDRLADTACASCIGDDWKRGGGSP